MMDWAEWQAALRHVEVRKDQISEVFFTLNSELSVRFHLLCVLGTQFIVE